MGANGGETLNSNETTNTLSRNFRELLKNTFVDLNKYRGFDLNNIKSGDLAVSTNFTQILTHATFGKDIYGYIEVLRKIPGVSHDNIITVKFDIIDAQNYIRVRGTNGELHVITGRETPVYSIDGVIQKEVSFRNLQTEIKLINAELGKQRNT